MDDLRITKQIMTTEELIKQIHLDKKYNFYIDKIQDMTICDFIDLFEILIKR